MNPRLPLGSPPAGAGGRTTSPVAVSRPARRLIGVMLVAGAALDLTDAASSWWPSGTPRRPPGWSWSAWPQQR
jgi:hypothetical protein